MKFRDEANGLIEHNICIYLGYYMFNRLNLNYTIFANKCLKV